MLLENVLACGLCGVVMVSALNFGGLGSILSWVTISLLQWVSPSEIVKCDRQTIREAWGGWGRGRGKVR